jgi:two-component system sensor histidine kinase AgrC
MLTFSIATLLNISALFFFTLKLLRISELISKRFIILMIIFLSSIVFVLGYTIFPWLQYILVYLFMYFFVGKVTHLFSNKTVSFIICFSILLNVVINYIENYAILELSKYFININPIYYYLLAQIIHVIIVFSISSEIYGNFNHSIRKNQFISTVYLISIVLLLQFILFTHFMTLENFNSEIINSSNLVILLIFGSAVLFALLGYGAYKQSKDTQKEIISRISNYTEQVEKLYGEVSTFRHDYLGVLYSLKLAIDREDMKMIKEIYARTIEPTEKILNNQNFEIAKLNKIEIPEIKSLVYAKINSACLQGISVFVDIPICIKEIKTKPYTMMRILSILLDNAIEDSRDSELKEMNVSLILDGAIFTIIISNSTSQETINLKKIYQHDYSTKKDTTHYKQRGWGLFSLKEIINEIKGATIHTTFIEPYFKQIVELPQE